MNKPKHPDGEIQVIEVLPAPKAPAPKKPAPKKPAPKKPAPKKPAPKHPWYRVAQEAFVGSYHRIADPEGYEGNEVHITVRDLVTDEVSQEKGRLTVIPSVDLRALVELAKLAPLLPGRTAVASRTRREQRELEAKAKARAALIAEALTHGDKAPEWLGTKLNVATESARRLIRKAKANPSGKTNPRV